MAGIFYFKIKLKNILNYKNYSYICLTLKTQTKMKHYNHITTLEINETETVVSIDFESDGFEIDIIKMTDMQTGDSIAPDLLGETNAVSLENELLEFAADFEAERRSNGRYSINY